MVAKAVVKDLRMTPRKVDYVLTPLRKRTVAEALAVLGATNRRASRPVAKAIASAFANARQRDPGVREEDLIVTRAFANAGPTWKRFRAAAFGRAARILKRTTHLTVELNRKPLARTHGS